MSDPSRRKRVIVTAGPTREHVDPVRYLSNESSGRMGFAIAEAAVAAGHEALLIAGPVCLETPPGVERVDVTSALDMLAALREHFPACDALYMAAAVADYRPAVRHAGKWKAKEASREGGAPGAVIELVENPDLLATIAADKGARTVIGFALETDDGLRRAREKMERKNADLVVLNGASALGAERTTVTILDRAGGETRLEDLPKAQVAAELVALLGA